MAKIAIVTVMPNFLRNLLPALKEAGHEYRSYIPTTDATRNIWGLASLCDWADLIFCEFCQHPMEIITDHIENKPLLARLWRIETFNSGFIQKVDWSKVSKLYLPTANIQDRFLKLREKKLKPKEIKLFKGPYVDLAKFNTEGRSISDKVRITLAGNVIPRKRAFTACQLLYELPPEYELTLAGALRDNEYATHIKDYCKSVDLVDRVRILQEIPHDSIADLFRDTDIILGLSAEETAHYALGEGMACGAFPVMSYWPDCETIFPDWAIHKGIGSIAKTLWQYGKLNPSVKEHRSKAAWDWARQNFDCYYEQEMILKDINELV